MPFPCPQSGAITRRNAVVYACLSPDPAQALLTGNGSIGVTLHTPDDSLLLMIARGDIWNEGGAQGAICAVRVRGEVGLFLGAQSVRQKCDLERARLEVELQTARGKVTFSLVCPRGQDALVLDILDERETKSPFFVSLENWHEGDQTRAVESDTLETVHVNRTSCFEEWNRKVGMDAAQLGQSDPILGRVWGLWMYAQNGRATTGHSLDLSPSSSHRIVMVALCRAPELNNLQSLRRSALALVRSDQSTVSRWLSDHENWWRDFWGKSYLALESASGDAEYEERLWHVALYGIACGSGGAYPMRFNGGPFLLERDERAWDGGFWFQNAREVFWPLFGAGHAHFARDLFEMFFQSAPFVRAQTQKLFGIEALSFKETQTFWGADCGTDVEQNSFHPLTHRYFSGNLEVCLLMDWYLGATGDEEFRRQKFFPFVKEIVAFYLEYARRDENGIFHIAPSNALETWTNVEDATPDVCGLHHFLPRLIQWGEELGEEAAQLERWREFLAHLPPIPVGRWTTQTRFQEGIHDETELVSAQLDPSGVFLPAAGAHGGERVVRSNMENAELYPVFPWGVVNLESPPEELRRAQLTWNHRTWRHINNGWAQDVLQLARLGLAEDARRASLEHASFSQRFPSGNFISPAPAHFHGLLTSTFFFDSAGVHAAGLNEMFLQAPNGILHLAPAVSSQWSGRFKLHALGFGVEAAFENGLPVGARISATRNALLKLRNTRREPFRAFWQGEKREIEAGALLEIELKAGQSVEIGWNVEVVPVEETARPDVVYPGYKVRPPLEAIQNGHWHDERKGHGQVGLSSDGLFPATRGQTPV